MLKRTLILLLALVFVMMPLVSCKEEEKKEEKKTEEKKTEEKVTEEEKDELPLVLRGVEVEELFYGQDPAEDGEFNVILIGNSYSYYWLDELWGLLDAAGYENVRVCDVYYSGCKFEQHWNWYQNGEKNYTFQIFESTERRTWTEAGLEECMTYANWDYIGFQQSGTYMYGGGPKNGPKKFEESVRKDLPNIYRLMYQNFPQAKYLWMQHWTHEIGSSSAKGTTQENQDAYHAGYKAFASVICEEYNLTNVPCGDAWQAIRHDPLFFELGNGTYPAKTMHDRVYSASFKSQAEMSQDDLSHDGDIGGGQYLNACVYFEILTHQSVVGNTFRAAYNWTHKNKIVTHSEEQASMMQNAAHDAVVGCHGEDWYA